MKRFWAELVRRDRLLAIAGAMFWALLLAMLCAAVVDQRTALGLNVWVKPSKFAASIAIYLWTVAWLMGELPGPGWAKSFVRRSTTIAMIVEMVAIAGQSARGVTSHFNAATAFDGAVFTMMGLFIMFNTLLEALLLVLFFQRGLSQPPAYLWGIRLGLVGSLIAAGVGGVMIAHGAHTVGTADGGPGLWMVNWSTVAGDLRVAHALGLHALQIIQLAGYALSRLSNRRAGMIGLGAFAAVYAAVIFAALGQALEGQPLLNLALAH